MGLNVPFDVPWEKLDASHSNHGAPHGYSPTRSLVRPVGSSMGINMCPSPMGVILVINPLQPTAGSSIGSLAPLPWEVPWDVPWDLWNFPGKFRMIYIYIYISWNPWGFPGISHGQSRGICYARPPFLHYTYIKFYQKLLRPRVFPRGCGLLGIPRYCDLP